MSTYDYSEDEQSEWYQLYSNHIFLYILVMVGDRDLAKDLMQDTFIKAFRNMESFRGDANPKTWLYKIARNVTIDYQRQKKPVSYLLDHLVSIKSMIKLHMI